MPDGSASASPTARSITDAERRLPSRLRPRPSARSGSSAALWAISSRFGRIRLPRSTSLKGVGTCWLTTRIISSGVTPLATRPATNEPALVPT